MRSITHLVLLAVGLTTIVTGCASPAATPEELPPTPQEKAIEPVSPLTVPGDDISPLPQPATTPAPGKESAATPAQAAGAVEQAKADLAARLNVLPEQIVVQAIQPIEWQTTAQHCPPSPDPTFSSDYIMIVTEDGARYEPIRKAHKPSGIPGVVVILAAGQDTYAYYITADQFTFCPGE